MTNLEWIQTMNIDDMIRFLSKVEMNGVVSYYWDARNKKTLREWLCMEYGGRRTMKENKIKELQIAKFALDKLVEKYPSMFDELGKKKSVYSYDELRTMRIRPTQAKADITYIRRLLLEVAKEL